jgi:hypothetical protein
MGNAFLELEHRDSAYLKLVYGDTPRFIPISRVDIYKPDKNASYKAMMKVPDGCIRVTGYNTSHLSNTLGTFLTSVDANQLGHILQNSTTVGFTNRISGSIGYLWSQHARPTTIYFWTTNTSSAAISGNFLNLNFGSGIVVTDFDFQRNYSNAVSSVTSMTFNNAVFKMIELEGADALLNFTMTNPVVDYMDFSSNPMLESVVLNCSSLDELGVGDSPNLKTLILRNTKLTEISLENCAVIRSIESYNNPSVNLESFVTNTTTPVSSILLSQSQSLGELDEAKYDSIRKLSVSAIPGLSASFSLADDSGLTILGLSGIAITDIQNLPEGLLDLTLTNLSALNFISFDGMASLSALTIVDCPNLRGFDLVPLAGLKHLTIRNTPISGALDLTGQEIIENISLTDTGITDVINLTPDELSSYNISRATQGGLTAFSAIDYPKLRTLILNNQSLSSTKTATITGCNELRNLTLVNSEISSVFLDNDLLSSILLHRNKFVNFALNNDHNLKTITLSANSVLRTLNLSGCSGLNYINCNNSPLLSSIRLSGTSPIGLYQPPLPYAGVNCQFCNLANAALDTMFTDLPSRVSLPIGFLSIMENPYNQFLQTAIATNKNYSIYNFVAVGG